MLYMFGNMNMIYKDLYYFLHNWYYIYLFVFHFEVCICVLLFKKKFFVGIHSFVRTLKSKRAYIFTIMLNGTKNVCIYIFWFLCIPGHTLWYGCLAFLACMKHVHLIVTRLEKKNFVDTLVCKFTNSHSFWFKQ